MTRLRISSIERSLMNLYRSSTGMKSTLSLVFYKYSLTYSKLQYLGGTTFRLPPLFLRVMPGSTTNELLNMVRCLQLRNEAQDLSLTHPISATDYTVFTIFNVKNGSFLLLM